MTPQTLLKLLLLAAVAWGTHRLGPVRMIEVWASGMAVLCGVTGLLMARQKPEQVTVVNKMAGVLLPWGYKVGRGRLVAIVLISWFIWALIGAVVVFGFRYWGFGWTGTPHAHAGPRSGLVMGLLVAAWAIDGLALLYTIGVIASAGDPSRFLRSLGGVLAALVGMIVASALLVTLSESAWAARLALGIAGGPPLVIGGGYALFLLVMLTVGRKARWN